MHRLKYVSSEQMFEGVIADFDGGSVTIDLKGRMGQLRIPRRLLITDYPLNLGQEVGFLMTYPEVLGPEADEEYAKLARRQLEIKSKIKESKK